MNTRSLGDRIKWLREQKGFTQQELAKKIRVSRTTITQIENGDRSMYHPDTLFHLARVLNVSVDALINPHDIGDGNIVDPELRVSIPRENEQKFKEVLLYILSKIGSKPNIGQTVIYKLLYFIDFDYYEIYEEQLIGATYIKNTYGPTPKRFKKIVEQMCLNGEIEEIKSEHYKYPQTKYLPLRDYNPALLTMQELNLIDDVLRRLSDKNATQISEYSHGDIPWLSTDEKKAIDYETVFYRQPPYSQRIYSED